MAENIKGGVMTQGEFAELRQDIRDLHSKIDCNNKDNHNAHAELHKELGKISERSGINTAKLGFFLVFIPILVAGLVNYGFATIG